MTDPAPRVFQRSAVTAVVSRDGGSLHVGTVELRLFRSFLVSFEDGRPSVSVEYGGAPESEERRTAVEEEKRALAAAGWSVRIP